MSKAIKNARSTFLSPQARREQDALTAKELNKKFPKKSSAKSRKRENLAKALKRKEAHTKGVKKIKLASSCASKRTTPGSTQTEFAPSYAHREGTRQIKNLNKKIKDQRTIAAHHGQSVKK